MEVVRQAIESATAAATSSSIPEQLRVTLLEAASKLVVALSKPEDVITKMAYQVSRAILPQLAAVDGNQ
jgi:hypothetical protein